MYIHLISLSLSLHDNLQVGLLENILWPTLAPKSYYLTWRLGYLMMLIGQSVRDVDALRWR
jgi:hypothetical protein